MVGHGYQSLILRGVSNKMTQFEYVVIDIAGQSGIAVERILDKYGWDHWEAFHITHDESKVYMKREIEE